jgi:hypothetical protein
MDHKNVKNVVGGGIYNSQVKKLKVMEISMVSLVWIIIYTFWIGYILGRREVINRINKKLNNK